MTLLRDLRRCGARLLAPAAVASALLAACGGGTSQVQAFHPARLVVFGDEASVIENDGSNDGFKYSINDRTNIAPGKCLALPTVVQTLASLYGFAFEQCNPNAATPKAFIRAMVNAKVDDPISGLAVQLSNQSDLGPSDIASVMIGTNDVIALYEQVQAGMSNSDAIAEVQRRGSHAADQINAILRTGARALVITMPDLGLSPYAFNADKNDPGASALLSTLSFEFNAYMRTGINSSAYDGRNYGLVLADDIVAAMAKTPTSNLSAPADVVDAACTTASAIDCVVTGDPTTTTLMTGATANTNLWATDRLLGPNAHSHIAAQAQARAVGNPF